MPISELTNRTDALKARTKDFAIRIFHLVEALPKSLQGRAVANQIIRSGTSVAANYRAAYRARSKREVIAAWNGGGGGRRQRVIIETGLLPITKLKPLPRDADELVSNT